MNFLTLAVLSFTLISNSAKADVRGAISEAGFSTSIAPSMSLFVCSGVAPHMGGDKKACAMALSANIGLTLSTILILKEEVKETEVDAYNFLAGDDISLALAEQMEKIRASSEQASELSDSDIALLIIQIANFEA